MSKEELKKYYQDKHVTGGYDQQREGTKYRKEKRKIELKHFLELLNKKPNQKVLELGCSSGFLTKHLGKVTAIDTSKDMLKITKQKNPKARVLEADMFKLPFKSKSFDKVVTMRVWNHLPKKELIMAIKESKRVLKDKGDLVFDFEDQSALRWIVNFFYKKIFNTTGYRVYQYSYGEISELLETEDFVIAEVRELKHRIGRQVIVRAIKI